MENKCNPIILFIRESWLLIVSSLCFGILLAGVNYALKPKIDANNSSKQNEALKELLTDAKTFETIEENQTIENLKNSVTIYKGVSGSDCAGWVFIATGSGYADKIDLLIAIDGGFEKIIGYKVLFSNETVGFGDKIKDEFFLNQFKGAPAESLELQKLGNDAKIDAEIIAISGATISSNAVVTIFNDYLEAVRAHLKQKGLIQ